VHLHGFSRKSVLLMRLARAAGKKVVVKLTSIGHDDPLSMQRRGGRQFAAYSRADAFIGVSPQFAALYKEAGFAEGRLRNIPNGVDLARFRPPTANEPSTLRRELGLDEELTLFLFVGFFSREKAPDLLFDAWTDTIASHPRTGLVFVGATRSKYHEVDATIADRIRRDADRLGVAARLSFVERTDEMEKYYRAADAFVLTSVREGLPNALLEAMASGLPCVASRLPGVTDAIIEDGTSGLLVPPGDRIALARALQAVVDGGITSTRLGAAARRVIDRDYALDVTAARHLDLYEELLGT
jgi:glycosyltransferase involved in cell wall biosynthesis